MATAHRQQRRVRPRRSAPSPAQQPVAATAGGGSLQRLWQQSTWLPAFSGAALLWMAHPPLGWSMLAWLAPLPWLGLICREKLPGRRAYLVLWLAGLVHWVILLQGVRLAHWLNYFGLLVLGSYLALYLPLFVGLARVAVHRYRLPIWFAAPVVWTGLELLRGHVLTGFSIALISHTQCAWPRLIQCADLFGAYGVSFLLLLVSGAIAGSALRTRHATAGSIVAAAGLLAALLYGHVRLGQAAVDAEAPTAKVALIQHAFITRLGAGAERSVEEFRGYQELSLQARGEHPDLDLIVWPESVYTASCPELTVEEPLQPPASVPIRLEEYRRVLNKVQAAAELKRTHLVESVNTRWKDGQPERLQIAMLVGGNCEVLKGGKSERFNSAMLLDPQGTITHRYDKMHPVMIGEYLPLGRQLPWLYAFSPIGSGLTPGEQPEVMEVAGVRFSPCICFESTVPQLIGRQLRQLERQQQPVDVLVCLSNDGWFHGSSMLDLHFRCGVFRAVENRTPLLIAANTGISAAIDGNGVVQESRGAMQEDFLVRTVGRDPRQSLYQRWGDLGAGGCLLICLLLGGGGLAAAWSSRAQSRS